MVKDNFVKPLQLKNISQTLFFAIIEVIGEGLRKAIKLWTKLSPLIKFVSIR